MESEEPFGDEMPNFDICWTVFKELFKDIDVLDIDAKTETDASSENIGRKSTFQLVSDFVTFFKNQYLFCNLTNEIRL